MATATSTTTIPKYCRVEGISLCVQRATITVVTGLNSKRAATVVGDIFTDPIWINTQAIAWPTIPKPSIQSQLVVVIGSPTTVSGFIGSILFTKTPFVISKPRSETVNITIVC